MKKITVLAGIFCMLALAFGALPAGAQPADTLGAVQNAPEGDARIMLFGPRYLIALAVGVALALAFQLLLTNLSVAAGLDLCKLQSNDDESDVAASAEKKHGHGMAHRITNVLGIWALGSSALALFFASLLAGTLGFLANAEAGAVFGLAIWAVFYILLVRFELNSATTAAGYLLSSTASALSAASTHTRNLLGAAGQLAGTKGPAYQSLRYRVENSDETIHQREQIRRMAFRLQADTGLTPEAIRELLYEFVQDPREGIDDLMVRLRTLNRERVRQILLEHENLTEEDVETILSHYDTAREHMLANKEQAREGFHKWSETLRHEAAVNAEATRSGLAQIAWWSFGIAIISGAASVVGGTLAAMLNSA